MLPKGRVCTKCDRRSMFGPRRLDRPIQYVNARMAQQVEGTRHSDGKGEHIAAAIWIDEEGVCAEGVLDKMNAAIRIEFQRSHFEELMNCRRDFSKSISLRFQEVRHGKSTQGGCDAWL